MTYLYYLTSPEPSICRKKASFFFRTVDGLFYRPSCEDHFMTRGIQDHSVVQVTKEEYEIWLLINS